VFEKPSHVAESGLFDPPEDFLNEYYATMLEFEKLYSSKNERARGLESLFRDTAELVSNSLIQFWTNIVWLAVLTVIFEKWELPISVELRDFTTGLSEQCRTVYENAQAILKDAPGLPRERKFSDAEISRVRQLLEE
jgi:hypothetical protein